MPVSLDKKPTAGQKVSLIKISDDDLVRAGVLAFEDGYADAREYGKSGFWVSGKYNAYERERYAEGFTKGLRVWRVMQRDVTSG